MKFQTKASAFIVISLTAVLFSFQNCGPNFKLAGNTELTSLISQSANPTVLSAPQHSVTSAAVKQGETMNFTISIPTALTADLPLSYETLGDTALPQQDFNAKMGIVTIPAGQTSVQVSVVSRLQKFAAATSQMKLRVFTSSDGQVVKQAEGLGQMTPAFDGLKLRSMSGRNYHFCGINMAFNPVCWGVNTFGQLGDGTLNASILPKTINLNNASLVVAGPNHSCAVANNASVYCWGLNNYGQLGNGTRVDSASPVLVLGMQATNVTNLALISGRTYAITAAGEVYGWGEGASSNPAQDPTLAVRIFAAGTADPRPRTMAAGESSLCFVTLQGTVMCLGSNQFGQLGRDPAQVPFSFEFQPVPGVTGALDIAAGFKHFCVRKLDRLSCWGGLRSEGGGDGVIFNPATLQGSFNAADVTVAQSRQVAAGNRHTCFINNDNTVSCWGLAREGQLGLGASVVDQNLPTLIPGLTNISSITSGAWLSCAVNITNDVYCWGSGYYGENGISLLTNSVIPVDHPTLSNVQYIGKSLNANGCLIVGATPATAQVSCFNAPVPGTEGAIQLTGGADFNCALIGVTGVVKCWGNNQLAQLGTGNTTSSPVPVEVVGLSRIKSISSGHYHTCAVTELDTVKCWGYNLFRQLANPALAQSPTPLDVAGLTGVKHLAVGGNVTCAVNGMSRVACWGVSPAFIAAPPPNQMVRELDGMTNAVSVAVSPASPNNYHVCAVIADGTVKCWGENLAGQLGNGNRISTATAVNVAGLGSLIKSVTLTNLMSCAVTVEDTVRCWGDNSSGAFGTANVGTGFINPVVAFGGIKVKLFEFIGGSSYALLENNSVRVSGSIGSQVRSPYQLLSPK